MVALDRARRGSGARASGQLAHSVSDRGERRGRERSCPGRRRHDRRRRHAAHPGGLDGVREVGIDLVDDQDGGDRLRTDGRRRRRSPRAPTRPSCGRRGPSVPHLRRSATRRPHGHAVRPGCWSTSGSDRIGPIDTSGFDGAITTTSACSSAASGDRAQPGLAAEVHRRDGDVVVQTDEVVLERDLTVFHGVDGRRDAVVGHRHDRDRARPTPGGSRR